ncbi:unnamed protein product [Schistosoma margrebowiei]|uniref:Uncharacterized protein n=1 Tax=Schistosoma margrebowiei TaxID=48269 RepID=A0A3P8EW38_9TREM|nr:unnamed protein product [Schistosoma margrebowiei]
MEHSRICIYNRIILPVLEAVTVTTTLVETVS